MNHLLNIKNALIKKGKISEEEYAVILYYYVDNCCIRV